MRPHPFSAARARATSGMSLLPLPLKFIIPTAKKRLRHSGLTW